MLSAATSKASRSSSGMRVERGLQLGGGHGQAVDAHAVEALGEVEHGPVAFAPHLRQDVPHRGDGTTLVEHGPREQLRERA